MEFNSPQQKLHPCEEVFGQPLAPILGPLVTYLKSQDLLSSEREIDHVCYRVETEEEYLEIVSSINRYGHVIASSMISKRPITTIMLHEPIYFEEFKISCIELPCPKLGSYYARGWEHIEVVVGNQEQGCIDNKVHLQQFIAQNCKSGLTFDTRAINKEINADVSISLYIHLETNEVVTTPTSSTQAFSVKFHIRPLYEVCKYEANHGCIEHVPIDYFGLREENVLLQQLIEKIKESEITDTKNWRNKDIMNAYSVNMIESNTLFQDACANIQDSNRYKTLQYIYSKLSRIIVKKNVSKNEYDIHTYVLDKIPQINTPKIFSYDALTLNGLLVMQRIGGRDLASVYGPEDGDTPREVYDTIREIVSLLCEHGIRYSDITSYNFIESDHDAGKIWIIDFGHATRLGTRTSYFIQEFLDGHNGWNPDFR